MTTSSKSNCNLLKPSGFIFVSVPQHMSHGPIGMSTQVILEDIQKELLSILSKLGFTVCIHLHLSFCFLLCFFATTFSFKSVPPSNDSLPAYLNLLFKSVMKLELFLLRHDIQLPFGVLFAKHKNSA